MAVCGVAWRINDKQRKRNKAYRVSAWHVLLCRCRRGNASHPALLIKAARGVARRL